MAEVTATMPGTLCSSCAALSVADRDVMRTHAMTRMLVQGLVVREDHADALHARAVASVDILRSVREHTRRLIGEGRLLRVQNRYARADTHAVMLRMPGVASSATSGRS